MDDRTARPVPEHRPDGSLTGDTVPAAEQPPEQHRGKGSGRSFFAELPVLVIVAFVLALLLKTFLVQAFFIPSSSMEPTLEVGDRVLVNKIAYTFREPRRGEVVVFSERGQPSPPGTGGNAFTRFMDSLSSGLGFTPPHERDFIKRVMGLPGETIEMRDGVVHIDGRPIPESTAGNGGYLSSLDRQPFGPVEIPAGHYFMMGDNRPNSADSRFSMGTIPRQDIIGRAFVVIWPLPRLDTLPIAEYVSAAAARPDSLARAPAHRPAHPPAHRPANADGRAAA